MSMQVSRVWWDGDKLMAEPISADQVYKPEPVTEWLTCPKCSHKSPYSPIKAKTLSEDEERITKQARAALAAERQAQQEPEYWLWACGQHIQVSLKKPEFPDAIPLYTSPPAQQEPYKQANPLGGPAKVFDAMADAIRAGDDYHAVLRQYGFAEQQEHVQQEPVAFIDMSQWPPIRWRDGMIRSDVAAFDGQPLVICGHRPQAREPVGRTDQEIVDETEALAKWLMAWSFNHHPTTKAPIRQSEHPFAKSCWAAACHIQEMLTATDPENAVAELDEVAKCRHCHGIGYDASGYACSCTQEAT